LFSLSWHSVLSSWLATPDQASLLSSVIEHSWTCSIFCRILLRAKILPAETSSIISMNLWQFCVINYLAPYVFWLIIVNLIGHFSHLLSFYFYFFSKYQNFKIIFWINQDYLFTWVMSWISFKVLVFKNILKKIKFFFCFKIIFLYFRLF